MNTKRSWLVWFAPLLVAAPISQIQCGGTASNPGSSSGGDASMSGASSGIGSTGTGSGSATGANSGTGSGATSTGTGSGATSTGTGSGATSTGAGGTGAGGTGASTGAGGTGASTGAAGTGASTGAAGTGASTGLSSDGGPNDPCTNGTYNCGRGLCSPTLGCVQCLTNTNCPVAGGFNPNAKICVAGVCEACGTNADCTMGQICEPSTHTCRASCIGDGGRACGGGALGGGAPICDMATGACVGCLTTANCAVDAGGRARTPVCDPVTQQCVQCEANPDCANSMAGKFCDTASTTCVQCLLNTDCPAGMPVCNANMHTCQNGCASNAQCSTSTGGLLPICDMATSRCVECTMASQCTGTGAMCLLNTCVGGGVGGGTTCNMPSDCSADGGGATPYCNGPNGRCVQCLRLANCPMGSVRCANGVCR